MGRILSCMGCDTRMLRVGRVDGWTVDGSLVAVGSHDSRTHPQANNLTGLLTTPLLLLLSGRRDGSR